MNLQSLFLIFFFFERYLISYAEDCASKITNSYSPSGRQNLIADIKTFSECCTTCYNRLYHAMYYHNPSSQCYCCTGDWKFIATAANYDSMIYYHPYKFHPRTCFVGTQQQITTVDPIRTTNPSDTNEVFAVDDMENALEKSKHIKFYKPWSKQSTPLKLTFVKDENSRRSTSYIHDLEAEVKFTENIIIQMKYFGYNGEVSNSSFWLVMMRSNDIFIAMNAEKIVVTPPNEYVCNNFNLSVKTLQIINGVGRVNVSMFAMGKCHTDLSNFKFKVHVQDDVEINKVENEKDCIRFPNISLTKESAEVQYDHYYAEQTICFLITLNLKNTTKLRRGIKTTAVVVDAAYNTFNGAEIVRQKQTKHSLLAIPDEYTSSKAFAIFTPTLGRCLKTYPEEYFQKMLTFPKEGNVYKNCDTFSPAPRRFITEDGKCLNIAADGSFSGNCSNQDASLHTEDPYIYSNGRIVSYSELSLKADQDAAVYRGNRGQFGLKKVSQDELLYEGKEDLISIINGGQSYFACVGTLNRTKSKCVHYNMMLKYIRVISKPIHKLLAYDNDNGRLYGEDKKGKIVYTSDQKTRYILTSRWEEVKRERNSSLSYAKNITRKELNDSSIPITDTIKVTYFGLFENDQPLIIWPSDSNCITQVGTSAESALRSCTALKNYCPKMKSGIYWIAAAYGSSTIGQVYCDMEFDEGGWTMLANHTANNTNVQVSSTFTSAHSTGNLFDVVESNFYKMAISYAAMQSIASNHGAITQMRFYCTTEDFGRTIHMATNPQHENGLNFIAYLSGVLANAPRACAAYHVYNDDTSKLLEDCNELGVAGKFTGLTVSNHRMAVQPFNLRTDHEFDISTYSCDSKLLSSGTAFKYGNWKIFFKNAI